MGRSRSFKAGEGGEPVRRTNHSAICADVMPIAAARDSDAGLTRYLRPFGSAKPRAERSIRQLVGEPRELGVDQQVGSRGSRINVTPSGSMVTHFSGGKR